MLGTQHLLANRQGPLVPWPRLRKMALGLEQKRYAIEDCGGTNMIAAERLFSDRQRALGKRPRLAKGRECPVPICLESVQQIGSPLLGSFRQRRIVADQLQRDPIKSARPWPGLRIVEDTLWIDRGNGLQQRPPPFLTRLAFAARRRHFAHQTM